MRKRVIFLVTLLALCLLVLAGCKSDSKKPDSPEDTSSPFSSNTQVLKHDVTPAPTSTPTPAATNTPTAAPTSTPTPEPTATPAPTSTPTPTATPVPTPEKISTAQIIEMLRAGQITTLDQFKETVVPDIVRVCNIKATCEVNFRDCEVNLDSENPYDVTWDYGEDYNQYVALIDWTTGAGAFSVDDYKAVYPLLALQYNNDAALLFRHFVTVGIHEGRIANKDYVTGDISDICELGQQPDLTCETVNAYLAAKCIAWKLLEYCKIDAGSDSGIAHVSGRHEVSYPVMTKIQVTELERINQYRAEVGSPDVKFNSELGAFANWRAWYNASNGLKAHEWAIENDPELDRYCQSINEDYTCYAENTTSNVNPTSNFAQHYRNSQLHYETMVNSKYEIAGASNCYNGKLSSSQFDLYMDIQ